MITSYISTFEDFKAAQHLHSKYNAAARARFWAWMIGLPALTVIFAVMMWHESHLEYGNGFGLAAWLTFCSAVGTISVVILRPWNLRRCFRKSRRVSGLEDETSIAVTFDNDGVVSAIPGRSEGRFFWTGLVGFAENSQLALLYIAPKRFLYIPKRCMNETEWESVRDMARTKGLVPHSY